VPTISASNFLLIVVSWIEGGSRVVARIGANSGLLAEGGPQPVWPERARRRPRRALDPTRLAGNWDPRYAGALHHTNDNDPVANGFVASLARPGGNITGLSTLSPEIYGKQLELLKKVVPRLSRVAVLGRRPSRATLKRYERRNALPGPSACSFNTWT
jgi:hypothetical protein